MKIIWNDVFFGKVDSLIRLGQKRSLVESDMLDLPENLDPQNTAVDFTKIHWTDAKKLAWDIFKIGKPFWGWGLFLYLGASFLQLMSPLLIHEFIQNLSSIQNNQLNLGLAISQAIGLSVLALLSGLGTQHYYYRVLLNHQFITNVVNEKIFRHSLQISKHSQDQRAVGDIVNHMSSDSDYVSDFATYICDLLVSTLTILVAMILLFYYLGWSALGAIAVLIVLTPVSKKIARNFSVLDEEMMKHRDARVTLMSQLLNAIRVIKYFNWEKSIQKEVISVREKELQARARMARSGLVASLIYVGISSLVVFVALGLHVLRGFDLTPALVFACIALFEVLEHPFGNLSNVISNLMSAKVAFQRLAQFFSAKTTETSQDLFEKKEFVTSGLRIQNWNVQYSSETPIVLKNWNLEIQPGHKVAIIGPVGSGKSTFLLSLLGELKTQGQIHWSPSRPQISFVSQEAYILNGSLRENLLFGNQNISDPEIMQALLLACFDQDFSQMSHGLNTEIGEKGVNLSGGQKQRISLARAILQKPQFVLLDDPLSAVDVQTENQLVQFLLQHEWKHLSLVMVTHRLEHLSLFDEILFVENGNIHSRGTFQHLVQTSPQFQKYLEDHHKSHQTEVEAPSLEASLPSSAQQESPRQTTDEEREFGAVRQHIYWDYIQSLGGAPFEKVRVLFFLFLISVLGSLLPFIEKAWLAQGVQKFSGILLMSVYGGIALLSLGAILLSDYYWMRRGLIASRRMHDEMLDSVLGAPIRFFDSTPAGRIVQRFSRDLENIDLQLQWSFENTFKAVIRLLITLFLIIGIMPLMVLFLAPILVVYYFMQKAYRSSAREAKRMDSMSRSPRYAHFKETILGLVTIRAYGKQNYFLSEFYTKLKNNQRMFYSHFMINRWFSAKIPLIGAVISLLTTLSSLFFISKGWIGVGTVGLLTIYSLSFWDILNWGVRIFADVEAKMTSVERVKFFSNLEQEKSTLKPQASEYELSQWPLNASIEFNKAELRYALHLPLVLKGISFQIDSAMKVGIIGRTGSGKSTLFQAIYRFVELSSGQIKIGGVDIASIPLNLLRKKLAIIPQDPTMFMGSLRQNMDRYNEYTDDQIWQVLTQVELNKHVENLNGQLQFAVSENGANFSQGQRQLFCLARALLIDAPIIILDEATASVDVQTDTQAQKILREKCVDKTVLIIAHRLGTVRDCDLIIEVSNGVVKRLIKPPRLKHPNLSGEGLEPHQE